MKIAYILTRSDSIGGASIHVLDLAKGMSARGHEVRVFVGGEGPFCNLLKQSTISFASVPALKRAINPLHDLRAYHQLKIAIKTFDPDLVHLHSSKAGLLGRLVCHGLKIPCIFTAHGWAFTPGVPKVQRKLYSLIERAAAPFANRIITVSDFDKYLGISHKVSDTDKIITILNGVADTSHRATPTAHSPVRLIMVARFDSQKDHTTLLRGLNRLKELEWHLELVGDGPLRNETEKLALSLGMNKRVTFSGTRTDIRARLAASDIFVLTSNWEGLPLSILEAMCAGLPAIASDVGGVSEAISDNKTGYIVPPNDPDALSEKLRILITSAFLRRKLSFAARACFEEKFTLQRMLSETASLYTQVLAETQR